MLAIGHDGSCNVQVGIMAMIYTKYRIVEMKQVQVSVFFASFANFANFANQTNRCLSLSIVFFQIIVKKRNWQRV